jgi:hypothetical protein
VELQSLWLSARSVDAPMAAAAAAGSAPAVDLELPVFHCLWCSASYSRRPHCEVLI